MRRAAGDWRKGKFNAERYPRVCLARDPTCSTHRFHVDIRFLKLITTREGEKREISLWSDIGNCGLLLYILRWKI